MTDYKSKTVLYWDNGLFIEGRHHARGDFGKGALLRMPWQSGYPSSNIKVIGHGIPGIKRIDNPWSYIDEVDLWVFPRRVREARPRSF